MYILSTHVVPIPTVSESLPFIDITPSPTSVSQIKIGLPILNTLVLNSFSFGSRVNVNLMFLSEPIVVACIPVIIPVFPWIDEIP